MILDDPIKNAEEANSETYREKTWDWYRSTAYTRLEPGGRIVLVMTRWHQNDLGGRILQDMRDGGDQWEIINLPAICEDENLPIERELGRRNGQALWPERYSVKDLETKKHVLGSYWYNALYQQRPSPPEGHIFKRQWFCYFEVEHLVADSDEGRTGDLVFTLHGHDETRRVLAAKCWAFGSTDLAVTINKRSDYTAVSVFLVTDRMELLWMACVRCKVEGPEHPKLIRDAFLNYRLEYMGIESVSYQASLCQTLLREGLAIRSLKAETDKLSRAITASVRYESGQIYHRLGQQWVNDAEEELVTFPTGNHDDMVDTVTYAAIEVSQYSEHLVREL